MDLDRDTATSRPARAANLELFGEGAPPRSLPEFDAPGVVYTELFFEAAPSTEHPRGWWAAKIWREAA